jgi:signal transduction histidine kinase/ActR/RegA family two-component response regulator
MESAAFNHQAALAQFGEFALRSDDLDEILNEACRLVGEALGTDLAKVVELQSDGETLLVRAGVGWKPGVVGIVKILASEDNSEGVALRTGEPVMSPDINKETRFKYAPFLIDNGVVALANVLILGSKGKPPFGILQIDSRITRQFTESDTTFLREYANLIAAAVDRMGKVEEQRNTDAQLRQSQKLEAIGRLAAGVAHDFNNILQSVISSLESALEDTQSGTPAHEFTGIALKSAIQGSSLTSYLLSYARKQMLQPKPVDLSSFLSEMQRLLSRTLGPQFQIDLKAAQVPTTIHVDSGQLHTALLNLSINASHAMPGGGTLTLETYEERVDKRQCVVIRVRDTGTGIDKATLTHVFEPFFTTKGLNGSGLGLSMVQGFAHQSGGGVRIESLQGEGTVVDLWLPVHSMTLATTIEPGIPAKLHGAGRIMLVDDAADVLATVAAFLEKAGFQVVKAASGVDALAILKQSEPFDVIVTDYAMAGMNGVELITKARLTKPKIAALLISGFTEVRPTDTLPFGVNLLRKPFLRRQMITALLEMIRKKADSHEI